MIALCIDGISNSKVQLEPDIIYRVGRRLGLEFYIDKESIELAHATIALMSGGIVRIAAVTGIVSVNGHETGLEVKSICEADAINGIVDLRFGNVLAKLRFDACNSANDTSGYEEEVKDKSLNVTTDRLCIPESELQTANSTVNMDSFVIPETQAFSLNRSAIVSKLPQISLDEDDLIPETQDVRHSISDNPITMDQNHGNEDVDSELGSQIRICTQDFNADATDDFDSSLIVGDSGLSMLKPFLEKDDKAGPDLDMSAMNWSTSNSQRTTLNITMANDTSKGADVCITPELSIAGQTNSDGFISPDIFDMIIAEQKKSSSERALNSTNKNQSVARMETPDDTPTDPLEDILRLSVTAEVHSYKENCTEIQVFPKKQSSSDMPKGNPVKLDGFVCTQTFIKCAQKGLSAPNDKVDTSLNNATEIPDRGEDVVETQFFISTQANRNEPDANADAEDCLQVPDTIKMDDDLDKELGQLIALSALPEEEHHIDQAIFENSHKESPSRSESSQIVEKQSEEKLSRNSVSSTLKPSESSTSRQTRKKQISKSTDSTEPAVESKGDVTSTNETRTRSKRSAAINQSLPAKKARVKTLQPNAGATPERLTAAEKDSDYGSKQEIRKSQKGAKQESQKSFNDDTESVISKRTMPGRRTKKPRSVSNLSKTGDDQEIVATVACRSTRQTRSKNTMEENVNGNIETSIHNAQNNETVETKHVDVRMKEVHNRRKSMESTETKQADEMPTTSANARRVATRRSRGPDPLKDINDYIRKIKGSGRQIRVAFSMCNSKELISVIDFQKYDIDVTNDPLECDVLIMDKGERTYKFLVAVATNKPILCSHWLNEMKKTRSIAVQPNHVFKDESFEIIFKFRPLSIFEKPSLLKGHHFLLGTNIHPNPIEMKAIIVSAGGKVYSRRPSIATKFKLFAVVSKHDTHIWQILRNFNNVYYIKTEAVMQALVRHDVDLLYEHTLDVRS